MAKSKARTFGQDLMRGEHVVGGGMRKPKGATGATAAAGLTFGEMKATPGHPRGDLPGAKAKKVRVSPGGGPVPLDRLRAEKASSTISGGLVYGEIEMHDGSDRTITGTSIFDPTLVELCVRWFCPPGGDIVDPFAGGSVRGIVAGMLGRNYLGIELRAEQVAANRVQAAQILPGAKNAGRVTWWTGDALDGLTRKWEPEDGCGPSVDFVFSCPPYYDLEVYSDDPRDLSTMSYPAFLEAYRAIINAACARLKDDRFACFVVGEVRDKKGNYRGFVPDTIRAFMDAGLGFYNEAILVTAAGSLPMRAGRQFETTRKLGRTHQSVLVFVKGDAKRATAAIGKVEFGDVPTSAPDEVI